MEHDSTILCPLGGIPTHYKLLAPSLIHCASRERNYCLVQRALYADPTVLNSKAHVKNETPLHYLAAGRRVGDAQGIMELLLSAGADLNIKNYADNTPLRLAVISSRMQVARLLLEAGADSRVSDMPGPRLDECPERPSLLHGAVMACPAFEEANDQLEVIQTLLQQGHYVDKAWQSRTRRLFDEVDDVNDNNLLTPLDCVLMVNDPNQIRLDILMLLLDSSADPDGALQPCIDGLQYFSPMEIMLGRFRDYSDRDWADLGTIENIWGVVLLLASYGGDISRTRSHLAKNGTPLIFNPGSYSRREVLRWAFKGPVVPNSNVYDVLQSWGWPTSRGEANEWLKIQGESDGEGDE